MPLTQLGTETLKPGSGSLPLPEGTILTCGNCGESCADHGQAVLSLEVNQCRDVMLTVSCKQCNHIGAPKLIAAS